MLQTKNACKGLMYRDLRCAPSVDCVEWYQVHKIT